MIRRWFEMQYLEGNKRVQICFQLGDLLNVWKINSGIVKTLRTSKELS